MVPGPDAGEFPRPSRRALVREGMRTALVAGAAVGTAGALRLAAVGASGDAIALALWSLAGVAATAGLVAAGRRLLDPAAAGASGGLGLPNTLTIVRLALTAPTACLLAQRHFAEAIVAYGLLLVTDVADGILARTGRRTSRFGTFMDPVADIASTFAIFTAFRVDKLIPLWLYVLLIVRYAMLGVGSLVLIKVAGPIAFRSTLPGKIVGVVQAAGALWIMVAAAGRVAAPGGPLFAFMGVGFASIVVSQAVIGYRHLRRNAPSGRGLHGGSAG